MKILRNNEYHLKFHRFVDVFLWLNQKVIFFSLFPLFILDFQSHLNYYLNSKNFQLNFVIEVNQLNKYHQNS